MSNHFNISNAQKNIFLNKQNEQKYYLKNQFSQKTKNDNNMNPTTVIIKKNKKYSLINNNEKKENTKINDIKTIKKEAKDNINDISEQTSKSKNSSKKIKMPINTNAKVVQVEMNPKTLIIHKNSKKLGNTHNSNNLRRSFNPKNQNKTSSVNKNNFNKDSNYNFLKDENNEVNRYLKNKSASKNYKKKNDFLKASININIFNNDLDEKANTIEEDKVNKLLEKTKSNTNTDLYRIEEENHPKLTPNPNETNIKENEKDSEKNNKQNLYNSAINNYTTDRNFKRPILRKQTFQSQISLGKENTKFNFEKKHSLNINSSKQLIAFRNSLRDATRGSVNSSINNVLIPMLNQRKENNCFLNVIIQSLVHLQNFKYDFLSKENSDIYTKSKPVYDLHDLIKLYESEQIKYKNILDKNRDYKIEPILSVNNLRTSLNQIYNRYHKGESGDPMETMNSLFDLIHEIYCKKMRIDKNKIKACKCLAHKHFFLKLAEIQLCPNCNNKKVQLYDKDCFMYNIFIKEIMDKLHGKSFNSFKSKFFQKLKEHNETFEEKKKPRIPGCNCSEKLMESYIKSTKLMGPISTYLIINITWAEEFPSMNEILKTFALLPVSEKINNLFTFDESVKNIINYTFSIKGIILYGIYHYVCAIYIKDENKWAVIDDKTIKYIDVYFNLIDSFLRNHLMPVGIIYSKEKKDALRESTINSMCLNKDEYNKLYQFCKDVDKRRGLKTSEIFQSKICFDESKGDYINNNLFFSIFDSMNLYNTNTNSKNTQELINNISISDKKNEINNEVNNNEDSNKKENKEKDTNKKVGGIFSFTSKFGNDLKGGIIDFSINQPKESINNNDNTKENKDDIDFSNIGNNYED